MLSRCGRFASGSFSKSDKLDIPHCFETDGTLEERGNGHCSVTSQEPMSYELC